MTPVTTIDSSAIHALEDMLAELKNSDVKVAFANCGNRIRRTMQFAGFQDHVGKEWFLPETHLAVKYCVRDVANIKGETSLSGGCGDSPPSKATSRWFPPPSGAEAEMDVADPGSAYISYV